MDEQTENANSKSAPGQALQTTLTGRTIPEAFRALASCNQDPGYGTSSQN